MGEPANVVHFAGSHADLIQLVRSTNGLVVISFYRNGCKACESFQREIVKAAGEYPGVKIVKVNGQETAGVQQAYGFNAVPFTIFVKGVQPDGTLQPLDSFKAGNVGALKKGLNNYK
jgi:thioredoxin-like negative regulator of GroEL